MFNIGVLQISRQLCNTIRSFLCLHRSYFSLVSVNSGILVNVRIFMIILDICFIMFRYIVGRSITFIESGLRICLSTLNSAYTPS